MIDVLSVSRRASILAAVANGRQRGPESYGTGREAGGLPIRSVPKLTVRRSVPNTCRVPSESFQATDRRLASSPPTHTTHLLDGTPGRHLPACRASLPTLQ